MHVNEKVNTSCTTTPNTAVVHSSFARACSLASAGEAGLIGLLELDLELGWFRAFGWLRKRRRPEKCKRV